MKPEKLGLALLVVLPIVIGSFPARSPAEVNVNIGIGIPLPPPLIIPVPPPMIPIPQTNVYFAPTVDVDILFFGGNWYRPYRDHWFRARFYNGPWVFIETHRVPRAVVSLPPGYRQVPPGHRHIPYGQFKKNWNRWDKNRYWDRDHDWRSEYWRHERRPPVPPRPGPEKAHKKPDKWHEGGPPGHQEKKDKNWEGRPPGHPGKGK